MITQTQLPVVDPSNMILGVVAISTTQFVGDETTFSVPDPGSQTVLQYTMRKVSVLRPDSVRMEFMAIAFNYQEIRLEYHRHVPGFAEVHTIMHNDDWVFATRQHIAPHRSQSALERLLTKDAY